MITFCFGGRAIASAVRTGAVGFENRLASKAGFLATTDISCHDARPDEESSSIPPAPTEWCKSQVVGRALSTPSSIG